MKDRFRLDEAHVNSFVDGRLTADGIANDLRQKGADPATIDDVHFIASGVQESFREKQLEPMLRVFYNRTAFQLPGDQRLRISLDTDMTFIREDHIDGRSRRHPPTNWRRNDLGVDPPFDYVSESDILRFPYAVLETKLQTHLGQEPPEWLTKLIESHLVHEVPRFSKYLHGASHFYRERLPLLPWWLAELNVDIRKPRSEHIGLTRSRSFKPLIDGRYRRAMIEETERANQQAIMDRHGSPATLVGKSSPSSPPSTPKRQGSFQSAKKGGFNLPWSRPSTPDYASVPMKTGAGYQSSSSLPPPLPEKGDWRSSRTLQDQAPPPSTKGTTHRWIEKMWGDGRRSTDDGSTYKRQRVKVRVEPKVFFANERTFISWLQFCALLLTVALSLLNFGDSTARIVGGLFICISALVSIYALYRFEKRAW